MTAGPAGLGEHFARHQEAQLDTHAGEPDAFASTLRAGGNVVIASQLAALHPAPIVHDRERRRRGIHRDADVGRTGIERVGDDLGHDGFFERPGVGVAKVFEEMLEVDARLAHTRHPIRFNGSNPFHAHTRCSLCEAGRRSSRRATERPAPVLGRRRTDSAISLATYWSVSARRSSRRTSARTAFCRVGGSRASVFHEASSSSGK